MACDPEKKTDRVFYVNRRMFTTLTGGMAVACGNGVYKASALPANEGNKNISNLYLKLIPEDKQLDPAWKKSLVERGVPTVVTDKQALLNVGMPIGGLFTGTLYLGGDGRLWLWDIFNKSSKGIQARKITYMGEKVNNVWGANYIDPAQPQHQIEQNFAIRVNGGALRTLDCEGFKNIRFQGQYPMATVSYADSTLPVSVELKAFSPFIPLNTDDSSLPATVMRYTISNDSDQVVDVDLIGWLENAVCHHSRDKNTLLSNTIIRQGSSTTLHCQASDGSGKNKKFLTASDHGSMSLCLSEEASMASAEMSSKGDLSLAKNEATAGIDKQLTGGLSKTLKLKPGQKQTVDFVVTWYFPNLTLPGLKNVGRFYAARFKDSNDVAEYVSSNMTRLADTTELWRDTWYDSSLPYWFLDRTMANTSTLATTTCYRFESGRFWAWEGVGCCGGTCTHVWHYAQAVGRLFPDIERQHRDQVDFGIAQSKDGQVGMRCTDNNKGNAATDGLSGRILGVYREHQMTTDKTFLDSIWPRVKMAMKWMIKEDGNEDGILEGAQRCTLDAAWYGKSSWLSSLYLAALRACEAMAEEVGDTAFNATCKQIADRGQEAILELFDGEYFYHIEDPDRPDEMGSGLGCHIDQVFGQSWAFQVGLGRIFDKEKQLSALRALYKYNFVPDVGPFRKEFTAGRWYAMEGDGGLLLCTWPKEGYKPELSSNRAFKYFNECMSGYEWQVASHMIYEGMQLEGLAISRAIHDRYDASKRNPYNEIECSDHYSRAMASYGAYTAASGYSYHGPKGVLGFDPKIHPEHFKAGFTTAKGWGSYSQEIEGTVQHHRIDLKYGQLMLKKLIFKVDSAQGAVEVLLGKTNCPVSSTVKEGSIEIEFKNELLITTDNPVLVCTIK